MDDSFNSGFNFSLYEMRKNKKTPSANENWVRRETKKQYDIDAENALAKAKRQESETPGKWVKVSDMPKTWKFIKK